MTLSRRSVLGYLAATFTRTPLEIDSISQFFIRAASQTDYTAWIPRTTEHPNYRKIIQFEKLRHLVKAVDSLLPDEKACSFAGDPERLHLAGWEAIRDSARDALTIFRPGNL